jgi:hypothetical protein
MVVRMEIDVQSSLECVMGILEDAHKCNIGILPYLSYSDLKKLIQTSRCIKSDIENSNILNSPIYNKNRIHEYHMKWYTKRTKCTYKEWCNHWDYLNRKNVTFYCINHTSTYETIEGFEDLNYYNTMDQYYDSSLDSEDERSQREYKMKFNKKHYENYLHFMELISKQEKGNNKVCIHCGCLEDYNPSGERMCYCKKCYSSGCVHTFFLQY